MAVTKINNLGGLLPSVSPRALPDNAAQRAHNLVATTTEFWPQRADISVAPAIPADPRTIYRMARTPTGDFNVNPADGWIAAADWRSYVRGQLNDDTTERTFYTLNDVNQPPRAVDVTGADRQLGVPAAATAPVVQLNEVDEYTPEDRDADAVSITTEAAKIIKAHMQPAWVGPEVVGNPAGAVAYMGKTSPEFEPDDPSQSVRLYGGNVGPNGNFVITETYSTLSPDQLSWVFDAGLGGFRGEKKTGGNYPGLVTTNAFWAIPYYGRAVTYKLNRSAFVPALTALEVAESQAFTVEQAEKLADEIDRLTLGDDIKPAFKAHQSKVGEILGLLDGGAAAAYVAQVRDFYKRNGTKSEIDTAVSVLAEDIWGFAEKVRNATVWQPPENWGHGS